MNIIADRRTMLDPERLQLVTRNFRTLQGLQRVALGSFMIIINIRIFRPGLSWSLPEIAEIVLWMAVVTILGRICIPRYYRSRFGRVQQSSNPSQVSLWWSLWLIFGVLVFIVVLRFTNVFDYVDPRRISLIPIIFGFAVLCYGLFSDPQLMSLRKGYLVPISFAAVFVTLYPIFVFIDETQLVFWRAVNAQLLWIGLIAMGLCDHILLLRLMPKRVSEDDDDG